MRITFIKKISIFCLFILVKVILTNTTVGFNTNNTCGSYNEILYDNESFVANKTSCLYYKDLKVHHSCCLVTFNDSDSHTVCNILNGTEQQLNTIESFECPGYKRKIPNNCGFAGLNEPLTVEDCTSADIPGLHCCKVETNISESSCRLLTYFAKPNQNSYNDFEEEIGGIVKITNITCNGFSIKSNKMIFLLFALFLYLI